MKENDSAMAEGFDPDTAPDLSRGGWPEKFAAEGVSAMGKWSNRFRPRYGRRPQGLNDDGEHQHR